MAWVMFRTVFMTIILYSIFELLTRVISSGKVYKDVQKKDKKDI